MKKHIKMLTDIAAVLAVVLVLTVALLPAGAVETGDKPAEESQSVSEPQETPASETTTEPVRTSGASGNAAVEAGTAETTENTTTSTTTATLTAAQTIAPIRPTWTEQPASGVMYVNTDGICSVEVAQIGSKKMKQYSLNDAVTVVAFTDTDYYKLEDGTFIHADFLSTSEIMITAGEETEPPVSETEETEPPVSETETETETETEDTPVSNQETAASE